MVKLGNILDPYLSQKLVQMDQSYLILANVQVTVVLDTVFLKSLPVHLGAPTQILEGRIY